MEKRILEMSTCSLTQPMSPCGFHIIDGNGVILGHLVYQLDKDSGVPVAYDEATVHIYEDWLTSKAPLIGPECVHSNPTEENRTCHYCGVTPVVVKIMPEFVQSRGRLALRGKHWLVNTQGMPTEYFSIMNLTPTIVPTGQITSGGKKFGDGWYSKHPVFHQLRKRGLNNQDSRIRWTENPGDDALTLEDLPLEVYEIMVKYMDGVSVKNLCATSSLLESTVLEALSSPKRKLRWYNFCMDDLDRSTIMKLLCRYDGKKVQENNPPLPDETDLSKSWKWKNVFTAYLKYWSTLASGTIKVTDLELLQRKLKGEQLCLEQAPPPERFRRSSAAYWTTRCAGGGLLYNIIFPGSFTPSNESNMIVTDMEEASCKNVSVICQNKSPSRYYAAKLVHFFVPTKGTVDRLVVGVCEKCISVTPLLGGTTSRCTLELREVEFTSSLMDPIFEISDKIVGLWLDPLNLVFFMITTVENKLSKFKIMKLYHLEFQSMSCIWDKIAEHRLDCMPVLREYKQVPSCEEPLPRVNSTLLGETYYGLAFVSHIYGVESFKPSFSVLSDFVESLEPQYYPNNGRQHLPLMREAKCSGKGHGIFVFCSDEAIAISWDAITWIFDKLTCLHKTGNYRRVYYVSVISDDGLLIVADDNIVFVKLTIKVNPPNIVKGINLSEPELQVKPLRIINLDFFPWCRKITQLELDFENGEPFLFVVADRIFRKLFRGTFTGEEKDGIDFVMKRFNFLNAEDNAGGTGD